MRSSIVEYKNFKISPELIRLINYMEPVEQSGEILNDLSENWDSLSLLSQFGDAGANVWSNF